MVVYILTIYLSIFNATDGTFLYKDKAILKVYNTKAECDEQLDRTITGKIVSYHLPFGVEKKNNKADIEGYEGLMRSDWAECKILKLEDK